MLSQSLRTGTDYVGELLWETLLRIEASEGFIWGEPAAVEFKQKVLEAIADLETSGGLSGLVKLKVD